MRIRIGFLKQALTLNHEDSTCDHHDHCEHLFLVVVSTRLVIEGMRDCVCVDPSFVVSLSGMRSAAPTLQAYGYISDAISALPLLVR